MSLGFNSIGHFFASAFHDIIIGAKAVEKAGVALAKNAPLVESLTALIPVYGAPAAVLERVAFGVFGEVVGVAHDVSAAATANGIDVHLDATMIADIKALIAQFPDIVAQAKAAFPAKPVSTPAPAAVKA